MKQKYYDLLGVNKDSSIEEIKKAHKKKAMQYHPDRNHGFKEEAEEKMKKINEARDFLIKNYNNNSSNYSNSDYQKEESKTSNNTKNNGTKTKKGERVRNRFGRVCHIIIYGLIVGGSLFAFSLGVIDGDDDLFIGALIWLVILILLYKLILTTIEYIFMGKFNFTFENEINLLKGYYRKITQNNIYKVLVRKVWKIIGVLLVFILLPVLIIGIAVPLWNEFNNISKSGDNNSTVLSEKTIVDIQDDNNIEYPGYQIEYDVIKYSEDVKLIQEALSKKGYNLKVDGYFGDDTKEKVLLFQKNNNLTQNAIIDNITWNLLFSNGSIANTPESKGEPVYQNGLDYYEREMLQNTNFRVSANTSSDVIAVIDKGTVIKMSGFFYENNEGKWYKVNYEIGGADRVGYINEIAFKSDGELKVDRVTLQNTNHRLYPNTSSSIIKVIPKGTTINVYKDPYENNEGFWYSLDYYISGELKSGYINDIAFKSDFELGINAEKEKNNYISEETNTYIDPNKTYFDCGVGGTYYDFDKACSCKIGFKKGEDGKCNEKPDCGVGGTYYDFDDACSCKIGYGKLGDGKCYK